MKNRRAARKFSKAIVVLLLPGCLAGQTAVEHALISGAVATPAGSAKGAGCQTYEDPVEIKTGIACDDLLRRFGQPAMRITSEGGEQTLYAQKDGRGQTQVRVLGGQVRSVDAGGKSAAAAVAK